MPFYVSVSCGYTRCGLPCYVVMQYHLNRTILMHGVAGIVLHLMLSCQPF